MAIPTPHTGTVIDPGETTDGYGDTVLTYEVPPATTRDVHGFFQPQATEESVTSERTAVTWDLIFFTEDSGIGPRQWVEWRGTTYIVDGQPRDGDTPDGFHHLEVRLQAVRG